MVYDRRGGVGRRPVHYPSARAAHARTGQAHSKPKNSPDHSLALSSLTHAYLCVACQPEPWFSPCLQKSKKNAGASKPPGIAGQHGALAAETPLDSFPCVKKVRRSIAWASCKRHARARSRHAR